MPGGLGAASLSLCAVRVVAPFHLPTFPAGVGTVDDLTTIGYGRNRVIPDKVTAIGAPVKVKREGPRAKEVS